MTKVKIKEEYLTQNIKSGLIERIRVLLFLEHSKINHMLRASISNKPHVIFVGYCALPVEGTGEEKTFAVFLENDCYFFCTESELRDESFFLVNGSGESHTLSWSMRQNTLQGWPESSIFVSGALSQQSQGIVPIYKRNKQHTNAYVLCEEIPSKLICAPKEHISV